MREARAVPRCGAAEEDDETRARLGRRGTRESVGWAARTTVARNARHRQLSVRMSSAAPRGGIGRPDSRGNVTLVRVGWMVEAIRLQ